MPEVHSLVEDTRAILNTRLCDLMQAAEDKSDDRRRRFAKRARHAAQLLETPSVTDRAHPYAARMLIELASRAEAPRR